MKLVVQYKGFDGRWRRSAWHDDRGPWVDKLSADEAMTFLAPMSKGYLTYRVVPYRPRRKKK